MKLKLTLENFINLFVLLAEGFLGLRFIFKLFGANASNGFVNWVYDMSSILLDPFRGIFPTRALDNNYVFEFSTLFAMLMYLVGGMLLIALVDAVVPAKPKKK